MAKHRSSVQPIALSTLVKVITTLLMVSGITALSRISLISTALQIALIFQVALILALADRPILLMFEVRTRERRRWKVDIISSLISSLFLWLPAMIVLLIFGQVFAQNAAKDTILFIIGCLSIAIELVIFPKKMGRIVAFSCSALKYEWRAQLVDLLQFCEERGLQRIMVQFHDRRADYQVSWCGDTREVNELVTFFWSLERDHLADDEITHRMDPFIIVKYLMQR